MSHIPLETVPQMGENEFADTDTLHERVGQKHVLVQYSSGICLYIVEDVTVPVADRL